ncbi:MAG TPA: beta-phosphoglucomutase family hydrolase, partial [Bacteroidales bacterium]|nr:beta-phosphoglucomutase family hydrolase [Bacteroidales bacterium]
MDFKAVIFDLDGVITQTALVHSKAWKSVFDDFLRRWSSEQQQAFEPFSKEHDYLTYVDGKPRYEGVRSFLESRGITLPYGSPEDLPDARTICGIGNRKNLAFNEILQNEGVETYPSTVALIHKLRTEGIRVGVASSSKNCRNILEITGLSPLIETRVDGEVSAALGLRGKPDPDIFTTAADNLGISYDACVVVEDAISGVTAARRGNFGLVLGIAREDNAEALYANGADIVVDDLENFGFEKMREWFEKGLPHDNWTISYHDYDPAKERSREALLSVGNGFFGTRGAMEEVLINDINYPGTYMAGCYNKLPSTVAGKEVWNEDFVNVTNWLPVTFATDDGDRVDPNTWKLLSIFRELSFRDGMLSRTMRVEDPGGNRFHIRSQRFASMENPRLAALRYEITSENYTGNIRIMSSLAGDHINDGVARYRDLNQQHLKPVNEWYYANFQHVEVETTQSALRIAQTARIELYQNGQPADGIFEGSCSDRVSALWSDVTVIPGDFITLEKFVFIDMYPAGEEQESQPEFVLNEISSFDGLHQESALAWESLWNRVDVQVSGDRLAQKLLRMHLYHLLCTTSPHNVNIDFGIPARGLTGEAYRGHIFWDELYILPIYFMNLPEVAKSVLMYRYRRLDAAREYARKYGYKGAMFPWQSGSTGEEETQLFHFNPLSGLWGDDHSSLQRHVSLAIAWNIIQYHHYTGDHDFMKQYGLEMLLEICRFWRSKATPNPDTGRYSIHKVMGPDEFHEGYPGAVEGGLRDNAYTNVMVAWMFRETAALSESLQDENTRKLFRTLKITRDEIAEWLDISAKLNLVISPDGIIAQYDGYFDLEEIDWEYYRGKYGNIYRLDRILKAEGKSPDQYKVAKQADMLMLFYNLDPLVVTDIISSMGYTLPEDYIRKNLEYYLQRTSHGSTLSRVVHAYLATLIGQDTLGWELYRDALTSDYDDVQGGTTAEGIHCGVMAGTVLIAVKAYAGLNLHGETPV